MQVKLNDAIEISRGKDPDATIVEDKTSTSCAILGRDYPDQSLRLLVEEAERVKAGQAILCVRRHPHIRITSPCSGVVQATHRGSGRRLVSVQIGYENGADVISFEIPGELDRQGLIDLMLESGLWPAVRSRPFDVIADPLTKPEALLITAMDTRPLAVNPAIVLLKYSREFSIGLGALCELVDAPVYLCKARGQSIELEKSIPVEKIEFNNQHPLGLVGTHIKALCPIRFDGNQVWHIGYQDVISLGCLLRSGKPWYQRVISLAGSAVKQPRLMTVPLGAGVGELIAGELSESKSSRVLSGSLVDGSDAAGYEAFLGRFHTQLIVENNVGPASRRSWLSRLFGNDSATHNALIAFPDLDRLTPEGILAVPLLRALLTGDIERARDLGALELVEDDIAMLSYCCSTGIDYGRLLRNTLNQIAREGMAVCHQA